MFTLVCVLRLIVLFAFTCSLWGFSLNVFCCLLLICYCMLADIDVLCGVVDLFVFMI